MFKKPVKIKSNTQVKRTERKVIQEKLLGAFPTLSESDVENLFSKKELVCAIKLTTASDETVHVYTVQKQPLVFDVSGTLLPTIYLLWKFPDLVPAFTTHSQVLPFLMSGADLMFPGVVSPPGVSRYGNIQEGAVAYVNLIDNRAAVAVGVAAQRSADMSCCGCRGKCLTIYHVVGDNLCNLESPNIPLVQLGPPEWLKLSSYNDDFPELGAKSSGNQNSVTEPDEVSLEETDAQNSEETTTEEMDQLLTQCFFVAIKYSKTLALPILTSNFYKLQMLPVCPEGKFLDIKKSSFKKLKPFLESMSKEGLVTIKEVKKGVESITAVNKDHPKFTEFYIEPSQRPRKDEAETSAAPSTSVTESFIITPNVAPIFAGTGLGKGDTVQMPQIRHHVTEYIKKNDCQLEDNKRLIKPKEALIKLCKTENPITWEETMEKVCEAMKCCFKVTSGTDELVNKGKLPPITMSISQRSKNKKVTLVDNLELFGIRIAEFAKECQHGVAASTSISRPVGKKCDQLLIQGNQILFVHNLLTEKYKIPVKYIKGLENAPKKKK